MSTSGINYFFENFTNLDPQTFKIFYDFQQTGSGAAIPSVSLGDDLYSGTINNYAPSFWSYSGSGFFTGGQYITINNSSNNLFSGSNLSFITVAQKSNTNNNILFSCADTGLVGPSFAYRGFTFGLNAANKLYFEYYGPSGLEIFTLPNILAEKNSLSVVLGEDTVTLGQYDFFNQQLNSETFSIDSDYLFNGSSWKIGSASGAPFFSVTGSSPFWMDLFCCWNTSLSETDISFINSGIVTSVNTTGLLSGNILINQVVDYITGSGVVSSGLLYTIAITGQSTDAFGNIFSGVTYSGVSGVTATGIIITPVTGQVLYPIFTGQEDILTINYPYLQDFGYQGVNYTSFPVSGNDINYAYFFTGYINTWSGLRVLVSSNYNKIKNNFNTNVTGNIAFYANGVFQTSGAATPSTNIYDPTISLEYSYNLTGFNINSNNFLDVLDQCFYDILSGNNQIAYSGFSYSGGANLLITGATQNSLIFFNGQALDRNNDYFQSGSNFYFGTGGLYQGSSGTLTLIQIPSGFRYTTGINPVIFSSGKFAPGYDLLFLNGVRQAEGETYASISAKDLLSGSGNCWLSNNVLYGNSNLFFT